MWSRCGSVRDALRKFLKKYTTEIHLCEYPGLNTPGISVEDREIPQNVKWHGDGTENTPFKIHHLEYTIWNTPFGIHHLEYPIWNTPFGIPLGALAADPWEPWQPPAWFSWEHDGFIYSALLPFLHHLRPLALRPARCCRCRSPLPLPLPLPPGAGAVVAAALRLQIQRAAEQREPGVKGEPRAQSPGEPGPRPRARESPEEPGRAREIPGEPGRARESSGELGGARSPEV